MFPSLLLCLIRMAYNPSTQLQEFSLRHSFGSFISHNNQKMIQADPLQRFCRLPGTPRLIGWCSVFPRRDRDVHKLRSLRSLNGALRCGLLTATSIGRNAMPWKSGTKFATAYREAIVAWSGIFFVAALFVAFLLFLTPIGWALLLEYPGWTAVFVLAYIPAALILSRVLAVPSALYYFDSVSRRLWSGR